MHIRRSTLFGLRYAEAGLFLLYAVAVVTMAVTHEPWADEAQAWLLARDNSLPSLLWEHLRYEGHPALWYLLLWVPAHLHLPYAALNGLSIVVAAAGTYVLLRWGPFPLFLRALIPFTFYLGYEYAVVARSYVLFPLLCFVAATLYRTARPRPAEMAAVLGLLANVSIHGTLLSIGFAMAYVVEMRRQRLDWAEMRLAAGVFAAALVFCGACLWPASDSAPRLSPTMAAAMRHVAIPARWVHAPTVAMPPATTSSTPAASGEGSGRVSAGNVDDMRPKQTGKGRLHNALPFLAYSFSSSRVVALLFFAGVATFLWQRRRLELMLPLAGLYGFFVLVYAAPWHLGLLWVACLMILWAAWESSGNQREPGLQHCLAIFLAVLCAFQMPWLAGAYAYDLREATSPDKAMATYLRTLPAKSRIAGFGMATGVLPYFDRNLFLNRAVTFADWKTTVGEPSLADVLTQLPDVIVIEPGMSRGMPTDRYRESRRFCGAIYFPRQRIEPECLSAFERVREATKF